MPTDELGPLAAALAKAQAEFPAIVRDKEVDSRSYKFKYAPLDSVISAVRPALAKNGLAFAQILDGDDLVTMLLHESGAVLQGRVGLPREGTVQQLGSAITYLRRYALQAILGVAAEEDDDGEAAPKTAPVQKPRQRGEITPIAAQTVPALSQKDIAELHARFGEELPSNAFTATEVDAALTAGLSSAELFSRAEEQGVPKARLTLAAKSMFGAERWKVTDLTDDERAALWEEVMVPA